MTAEDVVLFSYWMIVCVLLFVGVYDCYFYFADHQTVSEFLRQHPHWFWSGVVFIQVFLIGLATHLFYLKWL